MQPLHVVTAIFNPWRYQSRYNLYRRFEKYVMDTGAKLYTGELAFGDRPYEIVTGDDIEDPMYGARHYQFRTMHELWHKEKMLNRLVMELPKDWKYLAWIDADVQFSRPDWASEVVHLLQHYKVVQMFSHAIDLDPKFRPMATHQGFLYAHEEGLLSPSKHYQKFHPGFAWAIRRDAFEDLGGLFDVGILGAGDRHMALALVSDRRRQYPHGLAPGYIEQLELWQGRADRHVRRNVGHMPGTLLHYWHGRKADRRYRDRWQILVEHQYDPEFDLKNDAQGLWQWTDRSPQLHYDVRSYFRCRDEDSTHTGE